MASNNPFKPNDRVYISEGEFKGKVGIYHKEDHNPKYGLVKMEGLAVEFIPVAHGWLKLCKAQAGKEEAGEKEMVTLPKADFESMLDNLNEFILQGKEMQREMLRVAKANNMDLQYDLYEADLEDSN